MLLLSSFHIQLGSMPTSTSRVHMNGVKNKAYRALGLHPTCGIASSSFHEMMLPVTQLRVKIVIFFVYVHVYC